MSTAARRSHRGDEYQVAVAAYWVARLLWDHAIESVRVDAVALPGEGTPLEVDDVVIGFQDGTWRFIQAKKNQTDHGAWRLTDAVLREELCKARDQLESKPTGRVELCSRTPFGELAKLIEDGADYPDYAAFAASAPTTLKKPLAGLAGILDRDDETVLALLRRIEIGPHHDYDGWENLTRSLLEPQVTDVETALDAIDRLVRSQQSGLKARGDALRRADLLAALEERGVLPIPDGSEEEDAAAFAAASRIGRQWRRTIGGEPIPRPELQRLIEWAEAPEAASILLTDGPGTGKTCLLLDFADQVERRADWCLLFIKGDLFANCATEADLAAAGLPADLVARAARLARHRRVVVILDSLDVLSLHREHRSLRLFLTLLDRLERLPNLCVVTACRTFDLNYDPLLRERKWEKKLTLAPLDFETVVLPLLECHGIASDGFSAELKALLAVPENLRLLVDSAAGGAAPVDIAALTSAYQLQALYLEEVVRRDPLLGDPALTAVQALAYRMMRKRALRLPRAGVPTDEPRLHRLISQGVLAEPVTPASGQMIGFGHQTLLDALAVRAALAEGQTLAGFILAHPPFPFLRPTVRSFAMHLRATGPSAFRKELRAAVGEPGIAYHLKRVLIESLAEMVPTDADWPLIRHLWQAHTELFRRLLWQTRHDGWFRVLREHWWPVLGADPADDPVRGDFILRLDRWMDRAPVEVVALWNEAVGSGWGARLNLARGIRFELKDFRHWDTPGVEALLDALSADAGDDDYFLAMVLSRFVDDTGRGDERLWRHVCRDLTADDSYRPWHGLHCSRHDFHREDFLVSRLCTSDRLLDLVLGTIDSWSERDLELCDRNGLQYGLLGHTSWDLVHSRQDIRAHDGIEALMEALAEALRHHARKGTDWWHGNEPRLRTHRDLGIRYLLLLAYREDLRGNLPGITTQLLDAGLHRSGRLRYELGELANLCYPLLSEETQDRHQTLILGLYSGPDYTPDCTWCKEHIHQALLTIPAPFRCPAAQAFVDRWRRRFGEIRESPHLYSWGGTVAPPVHTQRILELSDRAIGHLLSRYTADDGGGSQMVLEGYVGGREELERQLGDAASDAPDRLLDLLPGLAAEACHSSFILAVLRGAATHLSYRFGGLRPPSGKWAPREPLPVGPVLAERMIGLVERYPEVWQDERAAARILKGCAAAAEGAESIARLVWLLVRLSRAKRPEQVRVRFDPGKRSEVEDRDLVMDAIKEPRGIAATTAMRVAERLLATGEPWPELLRPLLRRLASDPVASVRAGILRGLTYLHYREPELGWELLDRCLIDPHPALWGLASETLYYQLRDKFDRVAPYLERMSREAPGQSDDAWSRLSTMALLEGHLTEDALFAALEGMDRPGLWKGAAAVFSANMGNARLARVCRTGLLRLLDCTAEAEPILLLDRHLADGIGSSAADIELVARLIERIGPRTKSHDIFALPDWLAGTARRNPMAALHLLEKLAARLDGLDRAGPFLHGESLIVALLEILREADDSDDPARIGRAIALQDRFLGLGVIGMEEMLDKATAR